MRSTRSRARFKSKAHEPTHVANQTAVNVRRVNSESPIDIITELEEFEEFKQQLLPILRKAMLDKKPAKEILELARAHAAARIATIAATEVDAGKALAAARDILDRTEGKPVERKEFSHKLGKLKEEEIDALLISSLSELDGEEK